MKCLEAPAAVAIAMRVLALHREYPGAALCDHRLVPPLRSFVSKICWSIVIDHWQMGMSTPGDRDPFLLTKPPTRDSISLSFLLQKPREVLMGQVLVRGLDDTVIERLRQRAESHHRSLEAELREILEQVSRQLDVATARDLADRIRSRLEGRLHSDSAELIREDRER
jgi:antitoxin FitA